jgi:serine/threonine protein kinase
MKNALTHHAEDCPDELSPGTLLLHGQYVIEDYLIRGGFGITYLAKDSLDRRVVIKECFPNSICKRTDGQVHTLSAEQRDQFNSLLRHFLREARRLAKLSHPNIVGVHQVFEENSTAYMALDFVDGMDLLSVVEEDPQRLTPDVIRSMLIKSLGAISYIHDKGILHRDISPDNFLLDGADNLTLIDFGAAREHATKENRALSSLLAVKDGYSPQEFYHGEMSQCPSSDLYALGATFYHLITGGAPPDSQQRLAAIAAEAKDPFVPLALGSADYEPAFLKAINKVLEIFPEDRIQSAQDWVETIDAERRRQAALVRAGKDTTIRQKISQLVEESNHGPQSLESTLNTPQDIADDFPEVVRPIKIAPAEDSKPTSQPVDIFGEPIDDVDAWLRAQDKFVSGEPSPFVQKGGKISKSLRRRIPVADPSPHEPAPEPSRPRFLKSLMGRFSSAVILTSKSS